MVVGWWGKRKAFYCLNPTPPSSSLPLSSIRFIHNPLDPPPHRPLTEGWRGGRSCLFPPPPRGGFEARLGRLHRPPRWWLAGSVVSGRFFFCCAGAYYSRPLAVVDVQKPGQQAADSFFSLPPRVSSPLDGGGWVAVGYPPGHSLRPPPLVPGGGWGTLLMNPLHPAKPQPSKSSFLTLTPRLLRLRPEQDTKATRPQLGRAAFHRPVPNLFSTKTHSRLPILTPQRSVGGSVVAAA